MTRKRSKFEGGGKENGAWSMDWWVLYENSNSTLLNSCSMS